MIRSRALITKALQGDRFGRRDIPGRYETIPGFGFGNFAGSGRSAITLLRNHRNIDRHAEIVVGHADEAAGNGDRLIDIAGDGDADQIGTANRAIGRVIGNPAGAGEIDVGPCMRRAGADGDAGLTVGRRVVEISGHDAGAKAEAPGRLDQQHGIVAAGPPAAVERLDWGLRPLGVAALVGNPRCHTAIQVGQQRPGIGGIATHEAFSPRFDAAVRIGILALQSSGRDRCDRQPNR